MIYTAEYSSPLGRILLAGTEQALTGLWFVSQRHFASGLTRCREEKKLPLFEEAAAWLDAYFAGKRPGADTIALEPEGTAFQMLVWRQLRQIPYGEMLTYGALARQLDCKSAQAIGGAVGRNPISIFIPCHRVMGAGQRLTGYAGGLERKEFLLRLEGIIK